MRSIGLAITLCCSIGVHAQTIHRWVDENGVTHYGNISPPGGTPASGGGSSVTPAPRTPARETGGSTLLDRLAQGDPDIDRALLHARPRTGRQLLELLNARYGTSVPIIDAPQGVGGLPNSNCYFSLPYQLGDMFRQAHELHRPSYWGTRFDRERARLRLNRVLDQIAKGSVVHGPCIDRAPVEQLLAELTASLQQGEQAQRAREAERQRRQAEAAARAEAERRAAEAAEQERQRQARRAMLERRRRLQAGEIEPKDWRDAQLKHDAEDGRLILFRPRVVPDRQVYLLRSVALIRREADGLLIVNGGTDREPHYGAIRITPDTRTLDRQRWAFNYPLTAVGRYIDNLDYRTVLGARRTLPVFEALWVQP